MTAEGWFAFFVLVAATVSAGGLAVIMWLDWRDMKRREDRERRERLAELPWANKP